MRQKYILTGGTKDSSHPKSERFQGKNGVFRGCSSGCPSTVKKNSPTGLLFTVLGTTGLLSGGLKENLTVTSLFTLLYESVPSNDIQGIMDIICLHQYRM
jgi:hypothetical protein